MSHPRTPRLSPVIGLGRLVGLTFAVIAPVSSIFLTFGTAFHAAGTGIALGFAVGAVINLAVMYCYAELGSRFPEAGGDYALAARSLGRWAGSLYTVLFFIKGIAIPALLALSTAAYLHQLWAQLPVSPMGIAIFLVYLVLGALDLRTSSVVVTLMVTVELIVFVLFVVVAATHVRQPPSILLAPFHQHLDWMGAAIAALYGLNGPQACLYYSEETSASPRQVGRTILGAALVTATIEIGGVILGTLALPSLAVSPGTLPLAALIATSLGPRGGVLVLTAIAVALFDTGLATTMSYSRIFYAIGRDGQWPGIVNRATTWVTARGVPLGALLVLAAFNIAVMALSGIERLVTLGGTLLIVVYLGVIAGTAVMRVKSQPPYAMHGWPWPALIALAGLSFAAVSLSRFHLIATGLVVVLGLVWSLGASPERSG